MTVEPIASDDLAELEAQVVSALSRRDNAGLDIIGFGEISIALGYPAGAPRYVCKRTPYLSRAQFDDYRSLVDRYIAELAAAGLSVVETEVRSVDRDDGVVAYLVQPRLDDDTVGDKVLGRARPDAEHPFLVAVADTLATVSDRLSLDAQVTNWSWDGSLLTLLDVGTPFLWDPSGRLQFDMAPYLPMISAPLRPSARRDLTKVVERWQDPRGVALDIVANLYRQGLDDWVRPAVAALNAALNAAPGSAGDEAEPITETEAREIYADDLKTWPRLARLKRLERFWQTAIRRRHYDFFIQTTYTNDTIR